MVGLVYAGLGSWHSALDRFSLCLLLLFVWPAASHLGGIYFGVGRLHSLLGGRWLSVQVLLSSSFPFSSCFLLCLFLSFLRRHGFAGHFRRHPVAYGGGWAVG